MRTFGVEAYPSTLTPRKVAGLCQKYNLGDDVGACAPDLNHNINNNPEHMVGLYKNFLQAGLRFPISAFLAKMLRHYRISISQLSPNGYRKLLCFELLCKAFGLAPSKKLFRHFYHIAASDEWFTFSIRSKREHIVSGLKPYNKKWMNKFLWIKRSCFPAITAGGESWHLKRDTCPKLTNHLQGLVDIVKEHTIYDQNFPEAVFVAAGMSRNWPHDGFRPCFMEGENDVGLIGYLTQSSSHRMIRVGLERIPIPTGVVDVPLGMGEMGDNVVIPLRTGSRNAIAADPNISSSSRVINKRPRVADNEDLLGGGMQFGLVEAEVGIGQEDLLGLDNSLVPPDALTLFVNESSNFQLSPAFTIVPGDNIGLNVPVINANHPMQPMEVNQYLNNDFYLTQRENATHSSESLMRSSFQNGLQKTLKDGLSGGIDNNHSLFFSNDRFVTGAQMMVQNLNNEIERLRGENQDLKEKYDIALQLGNVVESLRQENASVRQDLMWVMRTAIPLMINKVIWSEEFTEGMLKVLEHVMMYGRQLGKSVDSDGFAAGTSNLEPSSSEFNLPQNVLDAYTVFRSTNWKCVDDILGSPYLSPSSLRLALGLSGTGSSQGSTNRPFGAVYP